ncbi:glycosyltransferase family 2 protein [Steroidobacter flavus]|uniref:Glycosyltransferase family 2 protein n=1 Tax=Steroidobacter flavus TaxID=1842136 RepID=A0ABV8SL40_9GAMM
MSKPEPAPASVSVIVPSHNGGPFLAEALDSILAQSLPVGQILIVDDGSTDNTAEVVARYKDRRIQYIRKPQAGLAAACNVGLEATRGEFITFLYPDDRWSPTFVERMHDYLGEDPGIACAFSNFVHLDEATGKMLGDQFRHYPEIKRPVLLKDAPNAHGRIPQDRAFGALVACSDIPAYLQVMMFRRSAIEGLRFEPSLGLGANTMFALQAFMQGMVVFTDDILAIVRRHDCKATLDPGNLAVQRLDGLKALAPHVTRERDVGPYRERLGRAQLDTAISLMKAGQARAGFRAYREGYKLPGPGLRKFQSTLRLFAALPQGLLK